jgi:hypothetical protein
LAKWLKVTVKFRSVFVWKFKGDGGQHLPLGHTIPILVDGILGLNVEVHDRSALQFHHLSRSEADRDIADVRRIDVRFQNPEERR